MLKTAEEPTIRSGRTEAHSLRADLVARARALVPLLERNAAKAEAERRLVSEVVEALSEAKMFRILQPRRFGGWEADFGTVLAVASELAKGCGSTAWVVSLMSTFTWTTSLGSDRLQQEVWGANPNARPVGSLAAQAESRYMEGGFRVTGKWAASSGCLHADWGVVGIPIVDAQDKVVGRGLAFIPMRELGIQDTWFVAGMKATGSNTLVAEDVAVPAHRVISVSALLEGDYPTPYKDEALYRAAFVPAAASMLVGLQLGLASRALELVIENAPKRPVAHTIYTTRTSAPAVQVAVARAAMLIDTATFHAYRAVDAIDEAARSGRILSYLERTRSRMDTGYVAETAREAIRLLCAANGTSSFSEASPLQRIWRDSEVAASHAAVYPEINAEIYGRALLGLTENISPLI